MTIETLKKALNLLDKKSAYATYCDQYYEKNPFDEDAEAAFDRAYDAEYRAFIWAADVLAHLIGIDESTARTMIRTKRSEIEALISRVA